MSANNLRDPREVLAREKYFTQRPKPLERWLWQQALPPSAERVFWFHWDLGAQNGDWCSQVPISRVAAQCCVDPATVTRAYQCLKRVELIRREEPPRDPLDPFRQAVAVTEVRVPRELLVTLSREPNRRSRRAVDEAATPELHACKSGPAPRQAAAQSSAAGSIEAPVEPRSVDRKTSAEVFKRMSPGELTRYGAASQARACSMEFDADSKLDGPARAVVLDTLARSAAARPANAPASVGRVATPQKTRRLPTLELVRLQRELAGLVTAQGRPGQNPAVLAREVAYSVEEGTLAKFAPLHAVNIALKKVREGAWTTPFRMPADWAVRRALPESCSAAGVSK